MAYNNFFPATYQQYYPQMPQPVAPPPQDNGGIVWVSGIEGAKSYLVAAGRSALLMDSEGSTFYIKSTDVSGMPQPLRIFDYTERSTQQQSNTIIDVPDTSKYITRDEFEERLSALAKGKKVESK